MPLARASWLGALPASLPSAAATEIGNNPDGAQDDTSGHGVIAQAGEAA